MELMLLKFFAWRLDFPTSTQFMDFYVAHSVTSQDCQGGRAITDCAKPKIYMKKYVHYFLEISLQGLLCIDESWAGKDFDRLNLQLKKGLVH